MLTTQFVSAQTNTDTITTIFSKRGTISGDTVFFDLPGQGDNLKRYFNKSLRIPVNAEDDPIFGYIDLYFTIDKAGYITQAWYDQNKDPEAAAGVLRYLRRFPVLRPTVIGKKTVITKMLVKIAIIGGQSENADALKISAEAKADFALVSFINYKKKEEITRATE